jgi:hypothetical protein
MNNPYIFRGPVHDPRMFFGRVHELQEIASFLRGNQSISIIGPRKIGKTSLLFHLMRPETWEPLGLDDAVLFAYLDCEVLGESEHGEIFAQFAAELAAVLDERELEPEPALESVLERPTRLSFESAVRRLNRRGLRVVLVLDEFERLSTNTHLDVNFFNALRSAAGRYQLAFLTASAQPLIQLTYSGRSKDILSSPFFNIFAPLFLRLMPEEEARRMIEQPARDAGAPFALEVQDFIYNLVSGHPLALQVACFHAFENPGDTIEIERRTMMELAPHFQYYWHNLDPIEQETLQHISRATSQAPHDTTLRGILRDLVQKCLLVSESGAYRYASRAWADFVAAQEGPVAPSPSRVQELRPGTYLGAYEVLESLGRGGMSEVYKGRHPRLDRTVAIKVLPAGLAADSDFRQRFEREAQSVAGLRHPNIVQVFDFGDVDGLYYMVMEFIEGTDLACYLRERGALELAEAQDILHDLAHALDYAHAEDLIHRDVKPSNVMLQVVTGGGSRRRAILTDFGIAKIRSADTGATKTGVMMGTLDYMAPEQIRTAGEVDQRADVYALGVMLYQMLTGELPFPGDNPGAVLMAHLQQPAPDPRLLLPDLPAGVALATLRALAKDPAERFASAGELAGAVTRQK